MTGEVKVKSRRPYLIRAIYDWALDNDLTPHLLVAADEPGVMVPRDYVQEGRIVLNIAPMAVQHFDPAADPLFFSARFGGRPVEIQVPVRAVLAVYARENGEGVAFGEPEGRNPPDPSSPAPGDDGSASPADGPRSGGRPKLRVVK